MPDEKSDEEIISGYLQNYAGDKSCFWAFEDVNTLIAEDTERAWLLTWEMIRRTTDKATLAYIAAGPLEDILAYHGDAFIDRVEALAKQDKHFRLALKSVWGQSRFSPLIYERVQKACKD